MVDRSGTTHLDSWRRSPEFKRVARASAIRNLRAMNAAPRCGAKRKRDGQPCEKPGMANGRCRVHGGLTPKGKDWHQVQWPKKDTAAGRLKVERKLRDLSRRADRLQVRLAAMTPDEREKYDAWQRTHQAGSAAAREAKREDRRRAEDVRRLLNRPGREQPAAETAEMVRLAEMIADLEQLAAEISAPSKPSSNVFD